MTDAGTPTESRLSAALNEVGITQARLAELIDQQPSAVSRWVNGVLEPRRPNKADILRVLRDNGWTGTSVDLWPVDDDDYQASCTRGH